ncbi:MAG: MarR family winged helix-turn-helix transcriptional regulator [Rhodothermia bacterium]
MSLSMHIIYAARHLLDVGHSDVVRDHPGLSQSDLSVLLSVHDEPGLTAKHIAKLLGRDKTTVSRSVAGLIRDGFIRSEIDSLDGRRRNLFLTEEGLGPTRQAANRIREEIERLTDHMTSEHVDMLNDFLRNLLPQKSPLK